MDVLCIYKNDIRQLAAKLTQTGAVSFRLNWIGNTKREISIDVSRSDDFGIHRWNPSPILVGEKISLVTTFANKIDEPKESFTHEQLVKQVRTQPKMMPAKKVRERLLEIGDLECRINGKRIFAFPLNSDSMLSVEFVWLGDRTGISVMEIGSEVSPKPRIPKITFGDEVIFFTNPRVGK